jgi:hypothetical protein
MDEPGVDKDPVEMPPTQIGRALQELGIAWIPAHSPQAKGRVERNFGTAQDRLVKGMRVAGVKTLEQADGFFTSCKPGLDLPFGSGPGQVLKGAGRNTLTHRRDEFRPAIPQRLARQCGAM